MLVEIGAKAGHPDGRLARLHGYELSLRLVFTGVAVVVSYTSSGRLLLLLLRLLRLLLLRPLPLLASVLVVPSGRGPMDGGAVQRRSRRVGVAVGVGVGVSAPAAAAAAAARAGTRSRRRRPR